MLGWSSALACWCPGEEKRSFLLGLVLKSLCKVLADTWCFKKFKGNELSLLLAYLGYFQDTSLALGASVILPMPLSP